MIFYEENCVKGVYALKGSWIHNNQISQSYHSISFRLSALRNRVPQDGDEEDLERFHTQLKSLIDQWRRSLLNGEMNKER